MFKQILSINKNNALVIIDNNVFSEDILNYYVIFEDNDKKILGEISEVDQNQVKINFLGEFINNKLLSGIIRKPS